MWRSPLAATDAPDSVLHIARPSPSGDITRSRFGAHCLELLPQTLNLAQPLFPNLKTGQLVVRALPPAYIAEIVAAWLSVFGPSVCAGDLHFRLVA